MQRLNVIRMNGTPQPFSNSPSGDFPFRQPAQGNGALPIIHVVAFRGLDVGNWMKEAVECNTGAHQFAPQMPRHVTPKPADAQRTRKPGPHQYPVARAEDASAGTLRLEQVAQKLLPDPGLWKLVRLADFIDLLSPQLANPTRLQPNHQIACYIQVYELLSPCNTAAVDDCAKREFGKAGRTQLLSYQLCRQFGLNLPRQQLGLAEANEEIMSGVLPTGARFFTLRAAVDPSAEPSARTTGEQPPMGVQKMHRRLQIPGVSAPWDIKCSRDEAIYDMSREAARGVFGRTFTLIGNKLSRGKWRKWRTLLAGKTTDQQLWEVAPPSNAWRTGTLKQWLEQTLAGGNYDVPVIAREWEIYWRQRGI